MKARTAKVFGSAALAWLLLVHSAQAQAVVVKIVGPGATDCAQYLAEIAGDPDAERVYLAWTQGDMSGILLRAPPGKDEDLNLTPTTFPVLRQAEFLRTYCSTHVSAAFADVVNELYRTLRAPPG